MGVSCNTHMRPRHLPEATQGHQRRNGATRARPGSHRKTTESDQVPPEASRASQEPLNAARRPPEGVLVASKTRLSRERCREKADPSRRHGGPPETTRRPPEGHFKATGGAQRPPKAARSHSNSNIAREVLRKKSNGNSCIVFLDRKTGRTAAETSKFRPRMGLPLQ